MTSQFIRSTEVVKMAFYSQLPELSIHASIGWVFGTRIIKKLYSGLFKQQNHLTKIIYSF